MIVKNNTKSFIDKAFKPIMVTCLLITVTAFGIVYFIEKVFPSPVPVSYTVAKTEDMSNEHIMQGTIHIYTEAVDENELEVITNEIMKKYNNFQLIHVSFYRLGDPIGYGSTVGSAKIENQKITQLDINTPEIEIEMRKIAEIVHTEAMKKTKVATKQVAQFTGSSSKQTKKFTIKSDQFTIKSRLSPDNDYGILIVSLYNSDGTLNNIVANTTDKSPTESTHYGAGEYYLDISVANGKYNVRVVEED